MYFISHLQSKLLGPGRAIVLLPGVGIGVCVDIDVGLGIGGGVGISKMFKFLCTSFLCDGQGAVRQVILSL